MPPQPIFRGVDDWIPDRLVRSFVGESGGGGDELAIERVLKEIAHQQQGVMRALAPVIAAHGDARVVEATHEPATSRDPSR